MPPGDRGVSNTLGFVLIFSIVLISLAMVSTAGLSGLQDTRDATMSLNAEQSFLDLASAIEDVHRENEPRRTASMRLGRGSLFTGEETTINVTIGGDHVFNATVDPIVYRLDDTKIVYEGTAIIREEGGGAAVIREPTWLLETDDASIIPLVTTQAETNDSIAGSNAQIHLRGGERETDVRTIGSGTSVIVEVETAEGREGAWERALESVSDGCTVSPGRVECTTALGLTGDVTVVTRTSEVSYSIAG